MENNFVAIFGIMITAVSGTYGWLIKHTWGHVTRKEIDNLKSTVQWKDVCEKECDKNTERYETLLREIKFTQTLVKNDGNPSPRVQT